jgi:hypothetical protein
MPTLSINTRFTIGQTVYFQADNEWFRGEIVRILVYENGHFYKFSYGVDSDYFYNKHYYEEDELTDQVPDGFGFIDSVLDNFPELGQEERAELKEKIRQLRKKASAKSLQANA